MSGWIQAAMQQNTISSFAMPSVSRLITFSDVICKGQIVSKELFGTLEFSKKTKEQICRSSKKKEFVRLFFGRIPGDQKPFRNSLTISRSVCSSFRLGIKVDVAFLKGQFTQAINKDFRR